MQDIQNNIDYGWSKPETFAHKYLLSSILKALKWTRTGNDAYILDAGCGGGYIMYELYKRGYGNVWGFDASISGIKVAKEKFTEIKDRFEIHNAYNKKLPSSFPQRDYDVVLSVEVIEHLYSPNKYLENVSEYLKPNGYLILSTPYHGYFKNLVISLLNKWDKHHTVNWEGGHIKFFSKYTMLQLASQHRLKLVKFYGSGRLPYLWKSMVIVAQKI